MGNLKSQPASEQVGFEVAVKNGQRPDGSKTVWAYYVSPFPKWQWLRASPAR